MIDARQRAVEAFAAAHGPCCAGCDWWRHVNSVAGECIRSVPLSASGMLAVSCIMLGGPVRLLLPYLPADVAALVARDYGWAASAQADA